MRPLDAGSTPRSSRAPPRATFAPAEAPTWRPLASKPSPSASRVRSRGRRVPPRSEPARPPRLTYAVLGDAAVQEQEQRLVRRRPVAGLRVRRIEVAVEPAGVRAREQADELRVVGMAEQPRAAPALRQRRRGGQPQPVGAA